MITTCCTIRRPIALHSVPYALNLMLQAYYPDLHAEGRGGLITQLNEFLSAARLGDFDRLITATLDVQFPDGLRRATIRTINTQYTALDPSGKNPELLHGYEPEIGALMDRLLPDDGIFCDIGANWGYFSIFAATRAGFAGTIHAFEPIPDSFADLRGLVRELGIERVVQCHEIALSNVNASSRMMIPDQFSGMARMSDDDRGIPVALKKLDDLDLGRVDFLKIDVEGHEAAAIAGARGTITAQRPYIIFEDALKTYGATDVSMLLDELDYILFAPYWHWHDDVVYPWPRAEDGPQQLHLFPFDYAEARTTFAGRLNILACHRDRIDELIATVRDDHVVR